MWRLSRQQDGLDLARDVGQELDRRLVKILVLGKVDDGLDLGAGVEQLLAPLVVGAAQGAGRVTGQGDSAQPSATKVVAALDYGRKMHLNAAHMTNNKAQPLRWIRACSWHLLQRVQFSIHLFQYNHESHLMNGIELLSQSWFREKTMALMQDTTNG